ncbi:MAG: hypothetical protein ONB23_11045 [candidate division KSB1 bacterium]|nr:hypothetical protein [candidate division KSB1 bacterium]
MKRIPCPSGVGRGLVASLTAMLLVGGCAGQKPAATRNELSYRWHKGRVLTYAVESRSKQAIETMGQSFQSETTSRLRLTVTTQQVYKDGSALIDFCIDSLFVQIKSPMGEITPDVTELVGKHVGMRIGRDGRLLEKPEAGQRLELSLGRMGTVDMEDNLRSVFLRLSGRPAVPGDTWSETDTTTVKRSGMDVKVISQSTNKLVDRRPFEGRDCYFGQKQGKLEMDGSGQEPSTGATIAFEAEGTLTSEWYFDPALGQLVYLEATAETEGTVAVAGQTEMTMPIETATQSTIRLVAAK